MASEASISSSRESVADGQGDSRAPVQRHGEGFPDKDGTALKGKQGPRTPKDRSLPSRPTACATDATFPKRLRQANTAKLYSELSTNRINASIEFHIDSMTTGLRDNRLIGAPG